VVPQLRSEAAHHRARPWRIHRLCADFTLLDVWRIPIDADPSRGEDLAAFYRVFVVNGTATDSRPANALFALRFWLGRVLHLDGATPLAIPACDETSVAARLNAGDRTANRLERVALPQHPIHASPIYLYEDEALIEVSNQTIHALLHLGWIDGAPGHKTVELAIYVKSRGRMSELYMALIKPFRHRLVYPAWIARICHTWRKTHPKPSAGEPPTT
jgi:hypothetical protein